MVGFTIVRFAMSGLAEAFSLAFSPASRLRATG
jgi:hypothetical protein